MLNLNKKNGTFFLYISVKKNSSVFNLTRNLKLETFDHGAFLYKVHELLLITLQRLPMCQNAQEFCRKIRGRHYCQGLVRTASPITIKTCLFSWTCVQYDGFVICLFSVCPVLSYCFCLVVINYIIIQLQYSR